MPITPVVVSGATVSSPSIPTSGMAKPLSIMGVKVATPRTSIQAETKTVGQIYPSKI